MRLLVVTFNPYLFVVACASKCLSDSSLQDVGQPLHAETLQCHTKTKTNKVTVES